MSVTMQREPLTSQIMDEMMPLLEAHWQEVAHYPDIPLDVDRDSYLLAEQTGLVRCFTVRTGWMIPSDEPGPRGDLVGYAVYFVRNNLHYRGSKQAVQDVIYLDPAIRGGTGSDFIAWCDTQLAVEGAQVAYQHVKAKHNFGKLLERQGYELVDLIYAKRLDTPKIFLAQPDGSLRSVEPPFPWSGVDETNDLNRTDETQGRVRGYMTNAVQ